ncbi:MAG: response regulator, partial [Bryobacterales bacterium]|nr:response regulator [Bryobacterales bacterium]
VADPSPVRRAGVVESIESLGFSATGCEDGEAAWRELLAAAQQGAPFTCLLASAGLPPAGAPALAARLAGPEAAAAAMGPAVRFVLLLPRSERCRASDYESLPGVTAALPAPAGLEEIALCLGPQVPAVASQAGAKLPAPKWQVLVAEDDKVNQRVVARMIERMGGQARLTANGFEAVEAFAQGGFDLILMDCQMPEMDGLEATMEIRRREAAAGKPRMPIVALTANAMPGDREACLGAGMDDYLPKPVRFDDLRSALARWRPHSLA